ncbi:MAG: 50S ribosomal protein L23 [Pseudomonadota bacterium]
MNAERIYQVLLGVHLSEKSAIVADESNQYTFKVAKTATKLEIKKAVEQLFSVNVEKVQLMNVKGKVKFNRFGASKRPSWKKAYVRLGEGQEIDFTQMAK